MEKFLIIDGNSILNRAFYAINARMTSKIAGVHTNAIYGFLNIYWMIKEKFEPDYVAVAFDLAKPTFRHNMYSEYKGTRKKAPDELLEQFPYIEEVLVAMNIPVIKKEGYEADDILGTVSNINTKNNIFTYILTGDRDSFQLISDSTSVILPKSGMGKTDYIIYDKNKLMEDYGILPYQVIETKSLMGDSSDNIPGVKGVGEKTAYSLIKEYENVDNIYKALDDNTLNTSDKIKEKLLVDKDNAYLSKTLATIILDVDININYEECKVSDIDYEKTYIIFKKLEFSKFLSKFDFSNVSEINLEDIQNNTNKEYQRYSPCTNIIVLNTKEDVENNIEKISSILNNNEYVSYLYNNPNLQYYFKNLGIENEFLAIYDNTNDEVIIININSKEKIYNNVIEMFATSKTKKIGYNIKQDIRYFFGYSNNVTNFDFDVMIAYYLLDATKQEYMLEHIINDIFGIILEDSKNSETDVQLNLFDHLQDVDNNKNNEILSDKNISNIACAIKCLYLAKDYVLNNLEKENMLKLFNEIEMPLTETLANMEFVGMHVNKDKISNFDIEISSRIKELTSKIYELAGEEFNINSTKQLGVILFEKLGLKGGKKTKTGYSTDKEVLENLENDHEIVPLLLEYRLLNKIKTTYIDGLIDKIDETGRIHTTFMQTVTATGRLSSIEPNLQNIPVRQELGGKIRTFFDAKDENNVIIDADYSQIELRMLADVSKDEKMIKAFLSGEDIHSSTASEVFNVDIKDVTSDLRRKAKAVNFGIVYGISQFGLSKNISSTPYEAKQYIDMYLEKYEKIAKFMDDIVKEATEKGYVTTMFGRRRYIKELSSKNKNVVKFGQRVALNTPIQGSAADIIKIAMNRVYNKLKENNLKSKLIMQVHDELLIECPKGEIEIASKILREEMQDVIKLSVPLVVDLNVASNWYEAK